MSPRKPDVLIPQYLRVTNYEHYQHYKDRKPIWVKLYVDLLDDYQLNRQKPAVRLCALLLILVAAKQDNKIPHDHEWLAANLHMGVGSVAASIETLVSIGFLSVANRNHSASRSIAKRSRSAMPEVETEREKRKRKKEPKAFGESQIIDIKDLLKEVG